MPPVPKRNPARRNQSTTRSTLTRDHDVVAPDLPDRDFGWHHLTVEWWADIWASPMAPEYDASDQHGLYVLADLIDAYWNAGNPKTRAGLASEIRLQRQCYGLTPIDRRRLQWEIARGDDAEQKTRARRNTKPPTSASGDDFAALRAVQ